MKFFTLGLVFFFCFTIPLWSFGDEPFLPQSVLRLQDCIRVALRHHPALHGAEYKTKASYLRTREAKSDYLPRIEFDSRYVRGNYTGLSGPTFLLITSIFTTYISSFQGSIIVEDFGQRFARVKQSQAELTQAEAGYQGLRNQIISKVTEAYFKLLQAQSLEKFHALQMKAAERHLRLAEGFVKTGEKPKVELLKAQTAYTSTRFDYLKSQQDVADAVTRLNTSMGLLNPPPYTLQEDFSMSSFTLELAAAKAMAFNVKPKLRLAHAKVIEADAKLNELRAQRYPVFSANGIYGWVDPTFPPRTVSWTLGMSVHWPIFEGNKLTHEINDALALEKSAEEEEKEIILEVSQEVEKDFRSWKSAEEQLSVAKEELTEAEETSRLAEGRYKVGLSTLLDVADAEANLARAKSHEVSALTEIQISLAALKYAVGIAEP